MTTEWQPIETCPKKTGRVLLRFPDDSIYAGSVERSTGKATHWAPLPVMPEPDPMTVVAWHPMEQLSLTGQAIVCLVDADDVDFAVYSATGTVKDNPRCKRFCALAPLLDLIPEDGTDG